MTDSTTYQRWIGHRLVDREGAKIGRIDQIYVDERTGQPTWMTVHTGLIGGQTSFVPLEGASPSGSDLVVPYSKEEIKRAPSTSPGSRLNPSEQRELHEYYERSRGGMGQGQEAAPEETGYDETTRGRMTEAEARDVHPSAGMAGEAGMPGERVPEEAAWSGEPEMAESETRRPLEAEPVAETRGRAEAPVRGVEGRNGETELTRFEEEVRIGTESVETGRARVRKHVETEDVRLRVPVSHEEVRIVREPVTEENRATVAGEPSLSESELEVILHEERPVVAKEIVPKERIRLVKETVTEERVVSDQVRKELIDMEGIEQQRGRPAAQQ